MKQTQGIQSYFDSFLMSRAVDGECLLFSNCGTALCIYLIHRVSLLDIDIDIDMGNYLCICF